MWDLFNVLFTVSGLLTFLGVVDLYFVNHAYYSTLIKGASVQLVFGFEVSGGVLYFIENFCQNVS